ncbi:MAG: DUF1295 domain-containing protein [Chloroflexota bacterium]|nr:DUF1295 domain-containing protein [Chloroflexota bacterium]
MVIRVLQIIACAGTVVTGLFALVSPLSAQGFIGLTVEDGRGISEIRAVLGGFFIALGTLGLMTTLWIVSLILKDASIVDIFWDPGFVMTCWVYFSLTPNGFMPRKRLISTLVTIWGLRLGLYILYRNWGKGEGFRYQEWRREAGSF